MKTVLNRSLDYISHIIFNMTDVAQMVEKLKLLVSMAGHNRQILNEIFKTDSWNEARVIKLRIRAYPGKFKKLKEMKISIKSRHWKQKWNFIKFLENLKMENKYRKKI